MHVCKTKEILTVFERAVVKTHYTFNSNYIVPSIVNAKSG